MSFTYKYLGDLPTVFTQLRKDGHTWVPDHGDTITLDDAIAHPLLELVKNAEKETVNEPAVPDTKSTPVTADEEEN